MHICVMLGQQAIEKLVRISIGLGILGWTDVHVDLVRVLVAAALSLNPVP